MKYINKLTFVTISIISLIVALLMTEELGFCRNVLGLNTGCFIPAKDSVEMVFISFTILTLPISLLTLPLKPAVFDAWKRYAIWSIPVILILVAWIETVGEGGGLPGQFHPGYLFYPIFFFIHFTISLIIIIRVWLKTRRV